MQHAHVEPGPYRLIVESVRDYALILLDATGHVASWNPGAEAIKGYSAEEVLGKHFSMFYPLEDRATRPARELEIATSVGRFEEEAWRLRKDGSRFWANVVLTAAKDETTTHNQPLTASRRLCRTLARGSVQENPDSDTPYR